MKTSNTYSNVAECISILDFNMEKLFDEMESGFASLFASESPIKNKVYESDTYKRSRNCSRQLQTRMHIGLHEYEQPDYKNQVARDNNLQKSRVIQSPIS